MRGFLCFVLQSVFFLALVGCAGDSRVFQESIAVVWQSQNFNDIARVTPMLPRYGYLRMHGTGGAILMVWTFLDKAPDSDLPIYVWQAGGGEIIKLQEGRVVGSSGFGSDWLMARYTEVPSWTQVLQNAMQNSYQYQRVADLKDKYQFGKAQQITLTRIPQPKGHALAGVLQPDIVWFEETAKGAELTPNFYGVVPNWNKTGQAKVVYTWHCFSAQECKGFQIWTTIDQDYVKARKP